ncbi:hypothetical protein TBR22_A50620 [Luteitalea sp. TBR-22]|uniref:BamA/TamA family outer membrane protein n=1 Tax=Luteitalea sp. TBR-22 TaxID=2802971 RepID=UPI001AF61C1E|nr:BamA/TamA family outer membrane protein [Luteitalea sp. TBR-22]BCS35828.1 hypothetical protein TBR22_A50620 [Luteitalea sp. TBR-22]
MSIARPTTVRLVVVAILLVASLVSGAVPAAGQTSAPAEAAPPPVETLDMADLLRKLRHKDTPEAPFDYRKRMLLFAPIIGAKPSTGAIFGAAGSVAFYRGDPVTTRISSSVVSATVTTRRQAGVSARTTMFGDGDRWRAEGDHRFQWTSLDTYPLGPDNQRAPGQLARFDFYRLYQSGYYSVAPHLYVGGGLHFDSHVNVRPAEDAEERWPGSSFVQYSLANGLPLDTQVSAGPSVEVVWDSRDNFINAERGSLARASYRTMFEGFLGGDSRWAKVNVDLRTYHRLSPTGRHKLAAWAYADLVTSGVAPYFGLPATGSDTYGHSGRGYAEGYFRGQSLAFLEVEYRGTITRNGLLGWVAFANTTTVSDVGGGQRLFERFAPGAGAGLRLLLDKRSRTNLTFDVGFGERGSRGIYLGIQEAF